MTDHQTFADVMAYYDGYAEEERLGTGVFRLEYVRTQQVLRRVLPPPPATIVDVGGAAGAYSLWLSAAGYDVHLVDASKRLVKEALNRSARADHPLASAVVGDARRLPHSDATADAVLIMGPLYHLTAAQDRATAVAEACRVLKPGGVLCVAAISRYASTLDGMLRRLTSDPNFVAIRDRDLADGQHRNSVGGNYFTTAYFHRPEDLERELRAAGLVKIEVLGIEGPGWLLGDFDARWDDPQAREELIEVATLLERESSILAISPHLLGVGIMRSE